ncbi:tRNA pseudouridine(55) synthase TruB [Bythopirellula polymerisocia]|uniref:tRNA pseudouridine synthase B n=1 Tax=Bythopirellula polymerisocia TaxID=2528003 RepID=A0A5C6CVD9_9BACT|nr:tRNA pseudouridine(55) synthase TruB [Bythopirellula polymerisocia]TWU28418.1 tRNA pseudouridine synthase B [Bythopirellula polymerisocia]
MLGFLNINKPPGWTSRDVVNRVQRLVRPARAGHAGTLDPLATGVLVVGVGRATRILKYVQQKPKRYEATFLLGRTSQSDDTETEMSEVAGAKVPTQVEIEKLLPRFFGSIEQRPPAYSAIKVAGRPAYALAREGKEVSLSLRTVEVFNLSIVRYEYPELKITIECGSGTYVRSLGRDLAESLGTGAVMSQLTRTAIGEFTLDKSMTVEELTQDRVAEKLFSLAAAVSHLPQLSLTSEQIRELEFGRPIAVEKYPLATDLAGIDGQGQLIAVLREKNPGLLATYRNFAPSA